MVAGFEVFRLVVDGKRCKRYPHELDERVINPGTMWQEEGASRAKLVEEKRFLFLRISDFNPLPISIGKANKSTSPMFL